MGPLSETPDLNWETAARHRFGLLGPKNRALLGHRRHD
jgi:hypothetical protein